MANLVPDAVTSAILEGETVLKLKEHGLLRWRRYEVFTDRRTLEVKGGRVTFQRELSPEETVGHLLEDGERLLLLQGQAGRVMGPEVNVTADATAVTNRRVLVFSFGEAGTELAWDLELSAVQGVDIARCEIPIMLGSGTGVVAKLWVPPREEIRENPETEGSFMLGLIDRHDLTALEPLPRKICTLTRLPLCPPERLYDEDKEEFDVGFFPKSDLKWPDRCAECGTTERDSDTKDVRWSGRNPIDTTGIGINEIVLAVPCCPECVGTWGTVKLEVFDGITVQLRVGSRDFAEEFCELNSIVEV